MKVALIPCGTTEWHGEGRLLGRVELPITSSGQETCSQWAAELEPVGLQRILHAPDELATQTASLLSRQLSIPAKALEDLVEVDVGLWAGLTESQLKSRYSTAHRELKEAPLNVNPPGGESLQDAAERLNECVRKQIKKNGKRAIGLVMRPFSFALTRYALEGGELSDMLEAARTAKTPVVIDLEPVLDSQAASPQ